MLHPCPFPSRRKGSKIGTENAQLHFMIALACKPENSNSYANCGDLFCARVGARWHQTCGEVCLPASQNIVLQAYILGTITTASAGAVEQHNIAQTRPLTTSHPRLHAMSPPLCMHCVHAMHAGAVTFAMPAETHAFCVRLCVGHSGLNCTLLS